MPTTAKPKKTNVINLFAGPGAGKSTTAARIIADVLSRCQDRDNE